MRRRESVGLCWLCQLSCDLRECQSVSVVMLHTPRDQTGFLDVTSACLNEHDLLVPCLTDAAGK